MQIVAENARVELQHEALHTSGTVTASGFAADEGIVALGRAPFPEDEPWWKRIAPTTLFALMAGLIGITLLLHEMSISGSLGFPLDAAWYHLDYARHFFHHVAFEFNVGERTPGTSAPLWTVILAFGLMLFHDPFLATKLFGSIFLFLTAYYAFRLLRAIEFDYASALIGGALACTIPRLVWAELAGIESTLASALVVAALWAYFSHLHGVRRYLSGVLFALAFLARPETGLLFLLVMAHWIVQHILEKNDASETPTYQHFWKDFATTLGIYLLITVPLLVTNQALAGSLIPPGLMAAITNDSLPVLLFKSDFGMLVRHILSSAVAIPTTFFAIFLKDHPLPIIAIIWAGFLLLRRPSRTSDSNEQFFTLGVLALFFFPYFHTLLLGAPNEYGEAARDISFLSVIYLLTGISALRIIAERYSLRRMNAKTLVLIMSATTLLMGSVVLWCYPSLTGISAVWPRLHFPQPNEALFTPFIFLILLVIATIAGFRIVQEGVHGAHSYAHDPRQLDQLTLVELRYGQTVDEKLPETTIHLLQGLLVLLFAWNVGTLPQAAREYGEDVRVANTTLVQTARSIGSFDPGSTIASNRIGALGWYAPEYRYVDSDGLLSAETARERLAEGEDSSLVHLLRANHVNHFILFENQLAKFAEDGNRDGWLVPERSVGTCAAIYAINLK